MTAPILPGNGARHSVENEKIDSYDADRQDKHPAAEPRRHRPRVAWHVIRIHKQTYSLRELGFRQWAYKADRVSFEREWKATQQYRNVIAATFEPRDNSLHRRARPSRIEAMADGDNACTGLASGMARLMTAATWSCAFMSQTSRRSMRRSASSDSASALELVPASERRKILHGASNRAAKD